MLENLNIVVPGFFAIVLVLCVIIYSALLIVNKIERREAMKQHPSNAKRTGLDSPEYKY